MENVFQRFNIDTTKVEPSTVLKAHKAYHDIRKALTSPTAEKDTNLSAARNKVKNEWLARVDLPPDLHDIIDDTENLLFTAAFEDDIKLLAPAYVRILALASELKRHLDDRVNREANPGGTKRELLGTKAEMKQLKIVAQSLGNVYETFKQMNDKLPDLPNLEWENIPPGRDVELASTPYVPGMMKYSRNPHAEAWLTKTEWLDELHAHTNRRWTRHEFDAYLEENGLSLRGDWSHVIDDVEFWQRRF